MLKDRFTHYRRTKKTKTEPKVVIKRKHEKWADHGKKEKKMRLAIEVNWVVASAGTGA